MGESCRDRSVIAGRLASVFEETVWWQRIRSIQNELTLFKPSVAVFWIRNIESKEIIDNFRVPRVNGPFLPNVKRRLHRLQVQFGGLSELDSLCSERLQVQLSLNRLPAVVSLQPGEPIRGLEFLSWHVDDFQIKLGHVVLPSRHGPGGLVALDE